MSKATFEEEIDVYTEEEWNALDDDGLRHLANTCHDEKGQFCEGGGGGAKVKGTPIIDKYGPEGPPLLAFDAPIEDVKKNVTLQKKFAKEAGFTGVSSHAGINPHVQAEYFNTAAQEMLWMKQNFDMPAVVDLRIGTSGLPSGPAGYATYGSWNGSSAMGTIYMNGSYGSYRSAHMIDTKKREFNQGFKSTDSPRHTFTHELAHAAHSAARAGGFGYPRFQGLDQSVANKVSRYGSTNPFEFVAEIVTAQRHRNYQMSPEERELYDRVNGPKRKRS